MQVVEMLDKTWEARDWDYRHYYSQHNSKSFVFTSASAAPQAPQGFAKRFRWMLHTQKACVTAGEGEALETPIISCVISTPAQTLSHISALSLLHWSGKWSLLAQTQTLLHFPWLLHKHFCRTVQNRRWCKMWKTSERLMKNYLPTGCTFTLKFG